MASASASRWRMSGLARREERMMTKRRATMPREETRRAKREGVGMLDQKRAMGVSATTAAGT